MEEVGVEESAVDSRALATIGSVIADTMLGLGFSEATATVLGNDMASKDNPESMDDGM